MKHEIADQLYTGEGFPLEPMDEVIATHFERLFILFDTFYEDSKSSLLHTENAFRSEQFQEAPTPFTAYQWAVERLCSPGPEVGSQAALPTIMCFLLRELGEFSYSEIGRMTGVDSQEVARHIAAARTYLVGKTHLS